MKDIYKKMYDSEKGLDLLDNPRIKSMVQIIDNLDLKDKKILDIGCYDGTFLSLIKNRNNNFFGIEASDFGFKKSSEREINVKQFFFNDKDHIPFQDNSFNIVVAGEIIEHIYDTDFFLKEIYRILKSNGLLLISTPNIASLGRRIFLLLGKNPIIEISPNDKDSSGHIRYFTFKTISDLLEKNNLCKVKVQSDIVNFSINGKIQSEILAKLIPSFGQSVIGLFRKK